MKRLSIAILCFLLLLVVPYSAAATARYDASCFSEQDLAQSMDRGNAAILNLQDGSTMRITASGTYILSGEYSNAQISVEASKNDTVILILDGIQITSIDTPVIQCSSADKLLIHLVEGSINRLAVSGTEEAAAISSDANLTINGSGTISIESKSGKGIEVKKALHITGGSIQIDAADHGITAKSYAAIAGASLNIQSGKDGIHLSSKDAQNGYLYFGSGSLTVHSIGDGISCSGNIQLDDGSFDIVSGGGSSNGEMKPSDALKGWDRYPSAQTASADTESVSAKGLKCDGNLSILGGSFVLDCAEDALHCGGSMYVDGCEIEIRTADDALHAEGTVQIVGNTINIPYCYEGIEGTHITVSGGTINIVSADDGVNATGTALTQPGFSKDMGAVITIDGGSITIVSDGDCIDSNGSIVLNGGTLNLACNGYGNTALDSETGITNNGAAVTTNDGSENGAGMMHGGMGGRGQHQGDFGSRGGFPQIGENGPMEMPNNDNRTPQQPPFGSWQR